MIAHGKDIAITTPLCRSAGQRFTNRQRTVRRELPETFAIERGKSQPINERDCRLRQPRGKQSDPNPDQGREYTISGRAAVIFCSPITPIATCEPIQPGGSCLSPMRQFHFDTLSGEPGLKSCARDAPKCKC